MMKEWLIDWLIGWLTDCLIEWLIDWDKPVPAGGRPGIEPGKPVIPDRGRS